MVVPGKKFESTLTRAIAVDLTESRGAWISSNGDATSKTIDWVWVLSGWLEADLRGIGRGEKHTEGSFVCSYGRFLGLSSHHREGRANFPSLAACQRRVDPVESRCSFEGSDEAGLAGMTEASVGKNGAR